MVLKELREWPVSLEGTGTIQSTNKLVKWTSKEWTRDVVAVRQSVAHEVLKHQWADVEVIRLNNNRLSFYIHYAIDVTFDRGCT